MSDKKNDTDLWIELTKVAAGVEFTRNGISEMNGKLDERNKIMREELRAIRKEISSVSDRVEKLEKTKLAGLAVFTFLIGVGGLLTWAAGVWDKLK